MSYTTLWEVPDDLWKKIEGILPEEKTAGSRGRPALPNRQVFNGILFVLRSGCQWKGLKKEWFGASRSVHARFQTWNEAGLWKKIFRVMVNYYDQERRIQGKWQAIDSKMVTAPLGGDLTGPNPTDRAKSGSKRHILVDQRGASLSILITAANTHDITWALTLVDRPIVARPKTKYRVHHLCADKGYDSELFDASYANERSSHTSGNAPMLPSRHHPLWNLSAIQLDGGLWSVPYPGKMTFAPCGSVGQRNRVIGWL